jgi:hypothetical protein
MQRCADRPARTADRRCGSAGRCWACSVFPNTVSSTDKTNSIGVSSSLNSSLVSAAVSDTLRLATASCQLCDTSPCRYPVARIECEDAYERRSGQQSGIDPVLLVLCIVRSVEKTNTTYASWSRSLTSTFAMNVDKNGYRKAVPRRHRPHGAQGCPGGKITTRNEHLTRWIFFQLPGGTQKCKCRRWLLPTSPRLRPSDSHI